MDGFFSFFGKFAIILLVVAILVGGGYFLGTGKLPFPQNPTPAAVTTTAPQPEAGQPLADTPASAIAMQQVTITGLTGTSFSGFTMSVPPDWTVNKGESAGVSQKLTISRGEYSISIYQAATGGAQCLYPGESGVEMSTTFSTFVTIHDGGGDEFRRATPTTSSSGFTICQRSGTTFGLPTSYGHITYTTPASPDSTILDQMDAIFATLKKS